MKKFLSYLLDFIMIVVMCSPLIIAIMDVYSGRVEKQIEEVATYNAIIDGQWKLECQSVGEIKSGIITGIPDDLLDTRSIMLVDDVPTIVDGNCTYTSIKKTK